MSYLVAKALHIIFMVTWFAGLLYLPRLFIYHTQSQDTPSHERFIIMQKRLFSIMSIGAVLTIIFGIVLIAKNPSVMSGGWLHAKLALVGLLIAYHLWCLRISLQLAKGEKPYSSRWLRFFNEVPAIILIAVVLLAILKPF